MGRCRGVFSSRGGAREERVAHRPEAPQRARQAPERGRASGGRARTRRRRWLKNEKVRPRARAREGPRGPSPSSS